jgi:hypothetical protein
MFWLWQARNRSPKPKDEHIARLYAQGVGTGAIAQRLGLSRRAVQDALNAHKFSPGAGTRTPPYQK